jgi:hypothetical protein
MRPRLPLVAPVLALALAGTAHAEEPQQPPVDPSTAPMIDPEMTRSWREGPARTFLATTVDAGYLYLRPRVSLGYGRPFGDWVGLDANPIAVGSGLGAYGGARFSLSWVDVRVGARYFGAFEHAFLAPKESYSRLDLDSTERGAAHYLTLEAELTASIPAGPGDILALGSLSSVEGVSPSTYLFEETLHIITAPPLVWRARGGYAVRLGKHGQHSIGMVTDILDVPRRDDSFTVRAGPVMRVVLSRNFEIRGSFVVTLVSPDRLGLIGGDFTELGVRWRTATE